MFGTSFHRKKLFVNRGIQGAISMRFAFYWVIYHLCLWNGAFMYFFIQSRLSNLMGASAPMRPLNEMYMQFFREYVPITIAATMLLPIAIYEMIRQTHRIAGPLVRFSNAMKDMMAGKTIQPVKLREGDMLGDFEKLFNEFVAFHQTKIAEAARLQADKVQAEKGTADTSDPYHVLEQVSRQIEATDQMAESNAD